MSESVRYTRELLTEAAGRCASMEEVVEFLGTKPYDNLHRYLRRRFERFGVDISHLRKRTQPTREMLAEAVVASISWASLLRRLEMPNSGAARTRLHKWIATYELDVSHFLGQAHNKGRQSHSRLSAHEVLALSTRTGRVKTDLLRRALRESGVPECCALCGVGTVWQGKPMTLEVDHIDGNWADNRRENLRLLCPNCHATTQTWCTGRTRVAGRTA